jgi:hypothetical protein
LTDVFEAGAHEEMVADLCIGVEFNQSAVKEILAKTLIYVAFGDPSRLRYQRASLTEHFDDKKNSSSITSVQRWWLLDGSLQRSKPKAVELLQGRLGDANPYEVAAELLGLLAASQSSGWSESDSMVSRVKMRTY